MTTTGSAKALKWEWAWGGQEGRGGQFTKSRSFKQSHWFNKQRDSWGKTIAQGFPGSGFIPSRTGD